MNDAQWFWATLAIERVYLEDSEIHVLCELNNVVPAHNETLTQPAVAHNCGKKRVR